MLVFLNLPFCFRYEKSAARKKPRFSVFLFNYYSAEALTNLIRSALAKSSEPSSLLSTASTV